uniref:Reverse transcriptase domain-containing protein n=1 Tax=Tanacetum cinerariifolium TaxID=118510 RepID=A0A6L2JN26_TANCI|nr:reverse transcriptase domain-containing protein [Tanacetum cinerariifolium]
MDVKPMWAADSFVALTLGSAITIPETVNEFSTKGASINLMPYSLYAKLFLETLKPTKMSVRLADQSFQYPIEIAENMLVEVDKFTFPVDFVILEMKEDSKVPLILGRPFFHTTDTKISEKLFAKFDEFMAMTTDESSESESDTEEPPFEKITFNVDYKIKTSLEEPPMDLDLKHLPNNMEYAFLEESSFLLTIVHTDHSALRLLFKKQDAKPHLILWILLLQEFDIEVKDRKGTKNLAADDLSRIKNDETSYHNEIDDNFPGETLMEVNSEDEPWFADFANYLVSDIIPKGMTYQQKKKSL